YPVVLLPKFFQMISPFLPFTYALGLMREAVGGIIWSNALTDVLMLALFGVIALIFGALLKGPINAHTNKLVKKSKESGVFHYTLLSLARFFEEQGKIFLLIFSMMIRKNKFVATLT